MSPNTIHEYIDANGSSPYADWLDQQESRVKASVISRVDRLELGHFGDTRQIDKEIYELKFRAGQRVYYVQEGKDIYLLLCAGDKSSQRKDIKLARQHWDKHNED